MYASSAIVVEDVWIPNLRRPIIDIPTIHIASGWLSYWPNGYTPFMRFVWIILQEGNCPRKTYYCLGYWNFPVRVIMLLPAVAKNISVTSRILKSLSWFGLFRSNMSSLFSQWRKKFVPGHHFLNSKVQNGIIGLVHWIWCQFCHPRAHTDTEKCLHFLWHHIFSPPVKSWACWQGCTVSCRKIGQCLFANHVVYKSVWQEVAKNFCRCCLCIMNQRSTSFVEGLQPLHISSFEIGTCT